jgi:hypothetical protein
VRSGVVRGRQAALLRMREPRPTGATEDLAMERLGRHSTPLQAFGRMMGQYAVRGGHGE